MGWKLIRAALPCALLTACVAPGMVPTVVVTMGPGKTPYDFSMDQTTCSAQVSQQLAGARAAASQAVGAALLTTDIDTAAATAQQNNAVLQQQFDMSYSACMYARGNIVPGYGPMYTDEPATRRRVRPRPAQTPATPASAPAASGFVEPPPSAGARSAAPGFAEPPPAAR